MTSKTEDKVLWLLAPGVTFMTEDCRQGKVIRNEGDKTIVTYDGTTETPEKATMIVTIAC